MRTAREVAASILVRWDEDDLHWHEVIADRRAVVNALGDWLCHECGCKELLAAYAGKGLCTCGLDAKVAEILETKGE